MECSNWLNIIGLLLNIVGFIFILINGLPTKYVDPRYKRAQPENDILGKRNIAREIHHGHRDKYNKRVGFIFKIGVLLNIIGLILQISANIDFQVLFAYFTKLLR